MNDQPTMRLCPACKVVRPRAEFQKNRRNPDGLQSACRGCQNARNLLSAWKRVQREMDAA